MEPEALCDLKHSDPVCGVCDQEGEATLYIMTVLECQCSTTFFNPLGLGPKNSRQESVFLWTLHYMPCKCSALGTPVSINSTTSMQCTIYVWDTYNVHGCAWGHTCIYIMFSVFLIHNQKFIKACKRSNHIQWALLQAHPAATKTIKLYPVSTIHAQKHVPQKILERTKKIYVALMCQISISLIC